MDAGIVAAIIAAATGLLTLVGTLVVQIYGIRRVSRDTDATVRRQQEQAERTLVQERLRTLNERFATAVGRLGSGKPPAVQLAAAHAMAGLADDWEEKRQTSVDVLCAYLRLPREPRPDDSASDAQRVAFEADREVRQTIIPVITAHLRPSAAISWQGLDLDFTGVCFDGGDFGGAVFSGATADFNQGDFDSGKVDFHGAKFTDGDVDFTVAEFGGAAVDFREAELCGCELSFSLTEFCGGWIGFSGAEFRGGRLGFTGADFTGGRVGFRLAAFLGATVDFRGTSKWSVPPEFDRHGHPPPGLLLPSRPR